jgi:UDP-2,3-diacylglucosamine hydrolase
MSSSSASSSSEPAAAAAGAGAPVAGTTVAPAPSGHMPSDDGRVSSLIASSDWQAVEFVSDLHLSPDTPRTAAGFERFLRDTHADAVVILGDLFEVWIGDDTEDDAFALARLAALRQAAMQRTVAMLVGNRDFLVGADLLAGHGVIALDDPTVLQAFGLQVVLAHGDALCLADTDYQAFRRQVRAPSWQAAFLARPRAERAAMARAMRDASEARKGEVMTTWADADPAATITMLDAHGSRTLVHGHTHRPHTHVPAVAGAPANSIRYVLGDWDLDCIAPRAEVLRLTAAGFERVPLS